MTKFAMHEIHSNILIDALRGCLTDSIFHLWSHAVFEANFIKETSLNLSVSGSLDVL